MYTGIGRIGHQDSLSNNMYNLNIDILSHKRDKKRIILFRKEEKIYKFIGEYKLIETHQNIQPDENNMLRQVFVFHLGQVCNEYKW